MLGQVRLLSNGKQSLPFDLHLGHPLVYHPITEAVTKGGTRWLELPLLEVWELGHCGVGGGARNRQLGIRTPPSFAVSGFPLLILHPD